MPKDLSKYMTREVIRVVLCQRDAEPTIEELTFEYLDKSDRLRVQAEMIRSILGTVFRMKPYPPPLNHPHLALWGNAASCIVARKHDKGGFQPLPDAELMAIVNEVRAYKPLFF